MITARSHCLDEAKAYSGTNCFPSTRQDAARVGELTIPCFSRRSIGGRVSARCYNGVFFRQRSLVLGPVGRPVNDTGQEKSYEQVQL